MRRVVALMVAAWIIGIATGLLYVAVSGGWYAYQLIGSSTQEQVLDELARGGVWEPVPNSASANLNGIWIRRPRFVLFR